VAARSLGIDLESARAAFIELDRNALAAVGVDVEDLDLTIPTRPTRGRRILPLTSGARTVLKRSIDLARATKAPRIESRHLLLGVLSCERPDSAAELLAALGVDPVEARARLLDSSN